MLCDYGVDGKIVAHEHIGDAYLMVGDLASAQKHLAALREICLLPCEELADLERGIAEYVKMSGAGRSRRAPFNHGH